MEAYLFLIALVFIGVIAQNKSLIIAAAFLLIVKAIGLDGRLFPSLQAKGITWGVTLITAAILVPIAAGDIGFKELIQSIRGHIGIISFLSGIFVAIVAAHGVGLMKEDPLVTTALLAGTILAVGLFRGVPVGPLIGAGIAALVIGMWDIIAKTFTG
ncbi:MULTISPECIES: DUF441 domain-containing protein [Exiguobacterium]|jgi:uncharacterized membrane protein (DUF441 family)|uniref:DUF441 domain-containing protein n=1 Tax=Exiguobacterium TaxID=33986 RepID=UPI0004488B3D|nr:MULTISPECIES: DUF441 domain-containing protein [unclassified Exiguobacterium]EZP60499.1 Membrane protein [Exiguobacterium sp. RIT341]KQS40425.1 hypothetical protein ASG02_08420 [Exiguobacterium sp. Leaf196]HAK99429.1 DUF441 domain-containing protein [Exiguobacterium sp.]HAZ39621.1 DUF441 domain-containing protein [Exiguobacterium sp.]